MPQPGAKLLKEDIASFSGLLLEESDSITPNTAYVSISTFWERISRKKGLICIAVQNVAEKYLEI